MTYLLQAMIACATTALVIVWMRRPAARLGLIDVPGGRKRHDIATPLTGGLAITVSLFCALSLSIPALGHYQVLLVAIALLAAVGILDDRGEVGSQTKLGAQLIAALLMTSWGGHILHSLGNLFDTGPIDLLNWSIPLTLFAAVAVINAINTFDGLDGLAGSLVLVMLGYFFVFAWSAGDASAMKILVVSIGAVLGFLCFNAPVSWRGPLTFMGDTGSQVLGIVVVWFSIEFAQPRDGAPPPVTMLWIVGIVLLDFFTITVRRVIRRRNPATPDRAHLHHLLVRRGLSPARVVVLLTLANVGFGAVGVGGWLLAVPEHTMFAAFVATGLAYFTIFLSPVAFMRLGRRSRRRAPVTEPPRPTPVWTPRKVATVSQLAGHPAASRDPASTPTWHQSPRRAARRRRVAVERSHPPGA